ncbi:MULTISPECIES: hypothetical protein [unclassified Sphingopyxis]|uniref:hypothetical protein n=1 Tax=unclassified Sphingopyxis TaxID=2614943 RepID=UPI0007316F1E|nr:MULTISPECIES: hypothetical protein [unclassified Sphingopyxis]KTE23897.1 hypothetical protein ATE61_15250 [Sphingopyxis sp. H057]KTE51050.1 hypothetical protein ATE64_14195 [Sphingopyxis sp. H073]KTE51261.1 hypothetical protein ATE69_16165 [Sphingopyxis sp. H071]KTE58832.1 hypothetical protein ATE66_13720 [Sphingopyxis sp. H107]KTE61223.1 hypothetical protein ATE65_18480 [Sphingopyxis sp. H100]
MLAVPACKYRAVIDANRQTFFDWAIPIIFGQTLFADERIPFLSDDEHMSLILFVIGNIMDDPALLADFMQANRKGAPKVFRAIR